MHGRAVLPTVSSPNWASMIMGVGPEQHGITSNEWERDEHVLPPVNEGPEKIFQLFSHSFVRVNQTQKSE